MGSREMATLLVSDSHYNNVETSRVLGWILSRKGCTLEQMADIIDALTDKMCLDNPERMAQLLAQILKRKTKLKNKFGALEMAKEHLAD